MANKRWDESGAFSVLRYDSFYGTQTVALLYKDRDGNWRYNSTIERKDEIYICDSSNDLEFAKKQVEIFTLNYLEGKRKFYADTISAFTED